MTPDDRREASAGEGVRVVGRRDHLRLHDRRELAKGARARADYTSLLRTAVFTGLRLGELLGLQWQDVDFEERVIIVQRQWTKTHEFSTPKTAAGTRRVPITTDMVALLRAEKETAFSKGRAKPEDLVFPSRTGDPMMHRSVQRAFESIRDKAGLAGGADLPRLAARLRLARCPCRRRDEDAVRGDGSLARDRDGSLYAHVQPRAGRGELPPGTGQCQHLLSHSPRK